jgi:hypothetical protein
VTLGKQWGAISVSSVGCRVVLERSAPPAALLTPVPGQGKVGAPALADEGWRVLEAALVELDDVLKRVIGSGDRSAFLMQDRAAERMDAVLRRSEVG